MDPMTIMAIGQAAGGVAQSVQGIVQNAQAKKIARNNKRPVYKIQQETMDNQALAESRASTGLSDAAMQVLKQGNERGLSSSLEAIMAGGGSVNNIGDLYGNYSDGVSKMALIDEEMRRRNIDNLVTQNMRLGAEKDKAWQVNVFAPYADKAQAAAALKAQGSQNLWKGINTVIGAGANAATAGQYKNEANNVYGSSGLNGVSGSNDAGFGLSDNQLSGGNVAAPGNPIPFNVNNPMSDLMWSMQPAAQPYQNMTPAQTVQSSFPGLTVGSIFDNGAIYKKR